VALLRRYIISIFRMNSHLVVKSVKVEQKHLVTEHGLIVRLTSSPAQHLALCSPNPAYPVLGCAASP
jgi:hypothetical protein